MKPRSPVQKNNLVVFPCEYTHVYPNRYNYYDARRLGQLSNFSVKLRLSSSVQTRVLGAKKNHIIETVVLSTHQIFFTNIFWLRNRKNNFLLRTLICRTDELPPLTRISHVLFISLGSLGD